MGRGGHILFGAPKVQPDRGSNSWPPDHDSAFHVTETPALTTRPSVICTQTSLSPVNTGMDMEELIPCTRQGWYSTVCSFFLMKSDVNIGTKDPQFQPIWGSNPWTLDHNRTFRATETFQNAQLFCMHILYNYTDKRLNINVIMHLRSWGWLPILFGPDV